MEWQFKPVILALVGLKQEDHCGFEAIFGYIIPYFKTNNQTKIKKANQINKVMTTNTHKTKRSKDKRGAGKVVLL